MTKESGRVLVIDDEAIVRDSIVAYLEDSGFDVIEAENGEAGIESFRLHNPQVVLCDLRMPKMDGLSVLKILRDISPDTPFIVVSGAGVMADVVEALRLGASDYLIKPILDLEILEHSIRRNLMRNRLQDENRHYREELEAKNRELQIRLDELRSDQQAGREVQRRMLPDDDVVFSNIDFRFRLIPSLYLSGDFVDYFPITATKVLFYLADVSGHGASSAFVTVLLKNITSRLRRNLKRQSSDEIMRPEAVLARINKELVDAHLGKHLSMFLGIIDLPSQVLSYSVGGQFPMPILVQSGQASYLEGKAPPVGLFTDAKYPVMTLELPASFDLIVLSDGILDALGDMSVAQKEERLLRLAEQKQLSVERIMSILESTGAELPDDVALLTLSRA